MATILESPARTSVRDPVCGMEIDASDAVAKRTLHDVAYYFCSDRCVAAFDTDPARYTAPASATTGVPASGAAPAQIALSVADLRREGTPALERVIAAVPGVVRAIVNVKDGRVVVEYDPMRASVADLLAAIRGAGFSPAGQTLRLKVSGLYCAECVARIEHALKAVPGVLDATMNAATNEVKVEYSPTVGDLKMLTQAIESAGPYTATRAAEASEPELDAEAQATAICCRAAARRSGGSGSRWALPAWPC
jgi:copper chaperone CopZ/YHS domain-containing protein